MQNCTTCELRDYCIPDECQKEKEPLNAPTFNSSEN
nr:MAG TPA: hypothetical protein [Caudoviricetes sp.]